LVANDADTFGPVFGEALGIPGQTETLRGFRRKTRARLTCKPARTRQRPPLVPCIAKRSRTDHLHNWSPGTVDVLRRRQRASSGDRPASLPSGLLCECRRLRPDLLIPFCPPDGLDRRNQFQVVGLWSLPPAHAEPLPRRMAPASPMYTRWQSVRAGDAVHASSSAQLETMNLKHPRTVGGSHSHASRECVDLAQHRTALEASHRLVTLPQFGE
jgi:hypothetical protein